MICSACGESTENVLCGLCMERHKKEKWTPCENRDCINPCPRKYCTPCHVEHKRNFKRCLTPGCKHSTKFDHCRTCNWKKLWTPCVTCKTMSPKRLCKDCFNTPAECSGCGGLCRPMSTCCRRCNKADWKPCSKCGQNCPFSKLCQHCFKKHDSCELCGVDSKHRFCSLCYNTPQSCTGCGGSRRPGCDYCRQCTESVWKSCKQCGDSTPMKLCVTCFRAEPAPKPRPEYECTSINCTTMTTRELCSHCYSIMGQYIYRRT
jgi:hypothetical protein